MNTLLSKTKRPPGRVLIICPHVDDASECMGGTILKYIENNWEVDILFMIEDEGVTNIVEANSIRYGFNYSYLKVDGKTFNANWLNEHPGLWVDEKDYTRGSPYHSKQRRRLVSRGGHGTLASLIRGLEIAIMAPQCNDCHEGTCECDPKPYNNVFIPNPYDSHEDNNVTHKAAIWALRHYKGNIVQYEYPKHHNFNGIHGTFIPNGYMPIDNQIEEKLRWCKTFTGARSNYSADQPNIIDDSVHYQTNKNAHAALIDTIESHCAVRGHHTTGRYAEVFKWTQYDMDGEFRN